jgi:uncharacterized protein (DUF2164 family)
MEMYQEAKNKLAGTAQSEVNRQLSAVRKKVLKANSPKDLADAEEALKNVQKYLSKNKDVLLNKTDTTSLSAKIGLNKLSAHSYKAGYKMYEKQVEDTRKLIEKRRSQLNESVILSADDVLLMEGLGLDTLL